MHVATVHVATVYAYSHRIHQKQLAAAVSASGRTYKDTGRMTEFHF